MAKSSRGGRRAGSGRPSEKQQVSLRGGNAPPVMPHDLVGDHARELWSRAVESLPHVLREVDAPVLRMACVLYQRFRDLELMMLEEPDNPKLHDMMISAANKFDTYANRIGLNPHCRRVIKPVEGESGEEKKDDPLEAWMKRGGLN